jgi:hypothetical protein
VAAPFGGHPKLARLVEWLQSVGCKADIKIRNHAITGQPYRSLEIVSMTGSRAVMVDPDMDEHLSPSIVSYFQRRLGMKTPFPGEPEQSGDVEYVQEIGEDKSG